MPFDISAIYHPDMSAVLISLGNTTATQHRIYKSQSNSIDTSSTFVFLEDISNTYMYLDNISGAILPVSYNIYEVFDDIPFNPIIGDMQQIIIDTNTPKMFDKISGIFTNTHVDSSNITVNISYPIYNNADKYQIFYTFDDPTFEQNIYQTEGLNMIESYDTSCNIIAPINQYRYLYFKVGVYSNIIGDLMTEPSNIFKVNLRGGANGIIIDDEDISYDMLNYISTNSDTYSTKDGNTYKGGFATYSYGEFSYGINASTALRNQIYTIRISRIPSTYSVFLGINTSNSTGFMIKIFDENNKIVTSALEYEITLYTQRNDAILDIFRRNNSFDKYIQIGQATAVDISMDFTTAIYYRFILTNNSEYRLVSELEQTTPLPISIPSNATPQDIIDTIISNSSVNNTTTIKTPDNNTIQVKIEKDPSGSIVPISKQGTNETVLISGLKTDAIVGSTSLPVINKNNLDISGIDQLISNDDKLLLNNSNLKNTIVPVSSWLIKLTNKNIPVDIGSVLQPDNIGLRFNNIKTNGAILANTKVFIARQETLSSPIEIIGVATTDNMGGFSFTLDNNSFITIFAINQQVQIITNPTQEYIYSQYLPRPYINDRSAEPITERKSQTTIASNYNAKVAANMNIPQFKSYDQYIQYKLASAYNCRCSF